MPQSLEPPAPDHHSGSPASSQWRWRLEASDGAEVSAAEGAGQSFPSQSDAESWLGEEWRTLLDAGVDQVTLFDGDREVYGPMSLHPSR